MNATFSNENITLLFSYPFQDPAWKKKLLIGVLLAMVSPLLLMIPGIFILGYSSRIIRRVAGEGGQAYLPEWDDWGGLFIDGLRLVVVSLFAAVPVLIFILPAMLLIYGSAFIPAIFSDSSSREIPSQLLVIPVVGSLGGMGLILMGTLVSLCFSLLLPAAISHVAVKQSVAAFFRFNEWGSIWRANMGGFLLCLVIILGLSFGLNIVFQFISLLVIICCPLYFVAIGAVTIYFNLVMFPLYAQVYRDGVQKLAEKSLSQG